MLTNEFIPVHLKEANKGLSKQLKAVKKRVKKEKRKSQSTRMWERLTDIF